jgi:hypothetical protein
VVGYLNPDGTATLAGQNLPAEDAALAGARVDALADAAKRAGAAAKIDHLRAEVFLGLLDGRWTGMTQQQIITELQRQYPKPADTPDQAPLYATARARQPRAGYVAAPAVPAAPPTAVGEIGAINGAAPDIAQDVQDAGTARCRRARRRRTAGTAKSGRPRSRARKGRRVQREQAPRPPP